jgi:hypothetical protein
MRLYLAGPMNGHPEYNYPTFHKAAVDLRAAGHFVFNPAEMTDHTDGEPVEYMLVGIAWIIAHAEGMAMLPGWEHSKGAKVEHALAEYLGLEIVFLD